MEPAGEPARDAPPEPPRSRTPLACAIAALVLLAVTLAARWPGQLFEDSIEQLRQARAGVYDDWHPPIMAWVWARFEAVLAGPGLVFITQCATFFAGLAALAAATIRRPRVAVATMVGFTVYPAVFPHLGYILKDTGFVSALLLALGLTLEARRRRSLAWLAASAPAFFYAVASRHNGIIAVAPVAALAALVGLEVAGRRRSIALAVALGLGATGVLAVAARAVSRAITEGRTYYPVQQVFLHDLVAISLATGHDELPGYLDAELPPGDPRTLEHLRALFVEENSCPLYFGAEPHVRRTTDAAEFRALAARWLEAVRAHPRLYLEHRARAFVVLMGFTSFYTAQYAPDLPRRERLRILSRIVFFRPWVYLLLIAVALGLGARARSPGLDAALAIGASGVLYVAAAFFVGGDPDFRLYWWIVPCALAMPAVLLGRATRAS